MKCKECNESVTSKENHPCCLCHHSLCGKHSYSWVDESNEAITKNANNYCLWCYINTYGKSRVPRYKLDIFEAVEN